MKLIDAEEIIRKQRHSMECLHAKSIPEMVEHIAIDDGAMAYMLALENYAKTKQWYHYLKGVLDSAPEVDAQPVVHGRWELKCLLPEGWHDTYLHECSECGRETKSWLIECPLKYCPHCGAKMDGEESNEVD